MYAEDDLIMISALQHFAFCERQCALIHLEQVWEENRLTAEGKCFTNAWIRRQAKAERTSGSRPPSASGR